MPRPETDMQQNSDSRPGPTLDPDEVERFSRLASDWWDPRGKFRPLHQIGPPRLSFIREHACEHLGLNSKSLQPFLGLNALDIGCGGGLIAEPLTRLGARVTAIDPAERNISIARTHAAAQNLEIDYRACEVQDLNAAGATFDLVTCLEVVEHVPDVAAFVAECGRTVRPGGMIVFSTINRTFKAWALAIIGAEYVLGWLPRGTHQWDRFVTPEELERYCDQAGLRDTRFEGMVYNPLRDVWLRSTDTEVNYLAAAIKI